MDCCSFTRLPRAAPTRGIDATQSVSGVVRGGLSLGTGLFSTRANPYLNGWAVTGFNIVGTSESDIANANSQQKYWQFSIGFNNPGQGITGIKITGISGLEIRINNAGTPATPSTAFINYGPRFWSLLYSNNESFSPYTIVSSYNSPTNTANLLLPVGNAWSAALRANPVYVNAENPSGYFRIVGLGVPSTQVQTTGSGILFSGSQPDWGLGGEILKTLTKTPIITTSGSAAIISSDTTRELIGGWNGTTGSSGPYRSFTNQSFIVQGTGNLSGERYLSLLFSEVEGGSKFGTYIGNGLANGPFITTNFSPKLIIIKNISYWPVSPNLEKTHWLMVDNFNNRTNPATSYYILNKPGTILNTTENNIEFFSNGFKVRTADSANCLINMNGQKYIYAAFAESPFKYNNAYTGA